MLKILVVWFFFKFGYPLTKTFNMKFSHILRSPHFVYLFSLLILIVSCHKEKAPNEELRNEDFAIVSKINAWLDTNLQTDTTQLTKKIIKLIKENLVFDKLSFEKLNDKEKICIVPLKESFNSRFNENKRKVTNVVFIINENDSIRKGNIVQFIPDNGQSISSIPLNTFHKILEIDGKFLFLSIKDRPIWEVGYKEGEPFSYGIAEARETATGANGRLNECINWFITTTIYYTDGTSYSYEEYVGTTCGEMCQDVRLANGRTYRVNCGGGSGGGSTTELSPKAVDWVVGASANGYWLVRSFETLNGVRTEPGPNGGYFTSITHNSSGIINNVPNEPGLPYGSWSEMQAVTSLQSSGGLAKSTVKGKISFSSFPDVYLDNFKLWFFYIEYP